MAVLDKWLEWRDDPSTPFYKVGDRLFYWAYNALFEKYPGVTSARVGKSDAALVYAALKNETGEFIECTA